MRWLFLAHLAAVCACGRLEFVPRGDAAAGGNEDAADTVDAAGPLCARFPSAYWCNDFEDDDLKGANSSTGGAIVAGAGWQGGRGFQITGPPGQQERLQVVLPSLLSDGPIHFGGRMHIGAGAPTSSFVVIAQIVPPTFTSKLSFDLNAMDRRQLANTFSGPSSTLGGDGSFPRGRWACFELAIVMAPPDGGVSVELFIDGALALTEWENERTVAVGGLRVVDFGAISSSPEPIIATFDNLVIGPDPIGCP